MKHHPEQKQDEIYMGNVSCREIENPFKSSIGWNTVSYGKIAYNSDGEPIEYMVPDFVKKSEIVNAINAEKYKIQLLDNPVGCSDNVRVWQEMVSHGTVFYEKKQDL